MKRTRILAIATAAVLALLLPHPSYALSLYVDGATVHEIRYYANYDAYLVSFVGGTMRTTETNPDGTSCSQFTHMIVSASSVGVPTTQAMVDRLMQELQIARALNLRVRVWTNHCQQLGVISGVPATYPKAYSVWVEP